MRGRSQPDRCRRRGRACRCIVALGMGLFIAACENDPAPLPRMTVSFEVEVDGQPVSLDSLQYVNAAGNRYSVERLQFYLSDLVFFYSAAGKSANPVAPEAHVPHYEIHHHYRDLNEPSTGSLVIDQFPNGHYDGMFFTLGFADTLNVTGHLPHGPPHDHMAWPSEYGGGYTFMKCDGRVSTGSGSTPYEVHTGRLRLGGSSYGGPEKFIVPSDFDAFPGEEWETRIVMNLNQWFAGSPPYDLLQSPGPIEGDSLAQAALKEQAVQTLRVEIRRLR